MVIIIIIIIIIVIIRCINPYKDKLNRTFDAPSVLSQVHPQLFGHLFPRLHPTLASSVANWRRNRGAAHVSRSVFQPHTVRSLLLAVSLHFACGCCSIAPPQSGDSYSSNR
jgi:hypothetical protein